MKKNSTYIHTVFTVLIATFSSGVHAHGGGCSDRPSWAMDLYEVLGVFCAICFVAALIYGLFAIRGKMWWQITTKLTLLAMFPIFSCLSFFLNLGFLMGCGGSVTLMIALNATPATIIILTVLCFKKLGANKFA